LQGQSVRGQNRPKICQGIDGLDAGKRSRSRDVDRLDDAVSDWAAEKCSFELTWSMDIVDELSSAPEQSRIL